MKGIGSVVSANDVMTENLGPTREQASRNAVTQFQARYGERPKEARTVKKSLDKDDFMKIMITEMQHQDPTKPMDSDRMATQMAQITSVEQMKNVGQAVEKLADKNSMADRLAMSAMIGRTVTVDKGRFNHQKSTISPINFELPQDAEKIKMTILDERGEEVAVKELEPMKAGPNVYNWDGLNSSGIYTKSGNYIVRLDAENAKGSKISVDSISKETIAGVSFEGGETNFLVGNAKSPQKVNFKNVIRIESDAPLAAKPAPKMGKNSEAAPVINDAAESSEESIIVNAANGSNDSFPVPESLKQALKEKNNEDEAVVAEGFPNGLRD